MSKEAVFTVFCLESYKQYRHLSGAEAANIFSRYGVFDVNVNKKLSQGACGRKVGP